MPGSRLEAAGAPTADVLDAMHESLGDSSAAGFHELRELAATIRNSMEYVRDHRIERSLVTRDDGSRVVVEHNIDTGSTRIVETL